jgi:hypothetical protein
MVSVSVRSHWRSSGRSGSATVRFRRERAGMGKRGLAALCVGTAARSRDAGVALGCCAQQDFGRRVGNGSGRVINLLSVKRLWV